MSDMPRRPYGPAAIEPPDYDYQAECANCGLPVGSERCWFDLKDELDFCDIRCLSEWIADHSDELARRWGRRT